MFEEVQCPKEAQGEGTGGGGVGWGQCILSQHHSASPRGSPVGLTPVHCGTSALPSVRHSPVRCGTPALPPLSEPGMTHSYPITHQGLPVPFHGAQSLPIVSCGSTLVCLVLCCGLWSHPSDSETQSHHVPAKYLALCHGSSLHLSSCTPLPTPSIPLPGPMPLSCPLVLQIPLPIPSPMGHFLYRLHPITPFLPLHPTHHSVCSQGPILPVSPQHPLPCSPCPSLQGAILTTMLATRNFSGKGGLPLAGGAGGCSSPSKAPPWAGAPLSLSCCLSLFIPSLP